MSVPAAGNGPRARPVDRRPWRVRAVEWLRANLFGGPRDTVLTLAGLALTVAVVVPLARWALLEATFAGDTAEACGGGGACWVFIRTHLNPFVYGFYPEAQRWRIHLALGLAAVLVVPLLSARRFRGKGWLAAGLLLVYPPVALILFRGGVLGLPPVETSQWGGLVLTIVLSATGIVGSFPIGILLALGRRSELPIARALSTAFIELWRGVPLITVLFMASVMLPLFLPPGVNFDKLLRAVVGITLFAGAYMAEVIRGGMEAVPAGQYEAAKALGLGYWRRMGLVVLPQALRNMIPGITNTFLALFKDTTLVLIIGLYDFLGIIQAAATDPKWLGYATEGYVFAGAVYYLFCYGMSQYSRSLEERFRAGRRRVEEG